MKLSLLRLSAIAALASASLLFIACSDDDDDNPIGPQPSVVPSNTIANIPATEFPATPTGGDPRGTYFANAPYYVITPTPMVRDSIITNRGHFRLVLKGNSATSGEAELICDTMLTQYRLVYSSNSGSSTVTWGSTFTASPALKTTGIWEVINGKLAIQVQHFDPAATVEYAVTSKGLFLFNSVGFLSGTTSVPVRYALKKQ